MNKRLPNILKMLGYGLLPAFTLAKKVVEAFDLASIFNTVMVALERICQRFWNWVFDLLGIPYHVDPLLLTFCGFLIGPAIWFFFKNLRTPMRPAPNGLLSERILVFVFPTMDETPTPKNWQDKGRDLAWKVAALATLIIAAALFQVLPLLSLVVLPNVAAYWAVRLFERQSIEMSPIQNGSSQDKTQVIVGSLVIFVFVVALTSIPLIVYLAFFSNVETPGEAQGFEFWLFVVLVAGAAALFMRALFYMDRYFASIGMYLASILALDLIVTKLNPLVMSLKDFLQS